MTYEFDQATIEPRDDGVRVYLWGNYPKHSVLAGQRCRVFLGDYDTEALARAALGEQRFRLRVEVLEAPSSRPYTSLAHLPGEDDPVPGGMYPDDIGEWPPEP